MPEQLEQLAITFTHCEKIPEHAKIIMTWRNDPQTLAMFYHPDEKQWPDFWEEYCKDYLVEEKNICLFITLSNTPCGLLKFIRLDQHPLGEQGSTVDVSINIAPEFRGHGIGCAALRACKAFMRDHYQIDYVFAEVKKSNLTSQQTFKKAGFLLLDETIKTIEDTGEQVNIFRYHCRTF